MRAIFFATCSPNNQCLINAFTCLGVDTKVVQYDVPGLNIQHVLQAERPDVAIYVGGHPRYHCNPFMPNSDLIAEANAVSPIIHICSDAADHPMWELLQEYNDKKSFRLQVLMDGCKNSPPAAYSHVELTPVDPANFAKVAWEDKPTPLGFSGGKGCRTAVLDFLQSRGAIEYFSGSPNRPYNEMCDFFTRCRAILNYGMTGSGQHFHIKGRVVEAGLAGAALFENDQSPLADWFEPHVDYLPWSSFEDILGLLQRPDEELKTMAARFHEKMVERHSAQAFWKRVFAIAGI